MVISKTFHGALLAVLLQMSQYVQAPKVCQILLIELFDCYGALIYRLYPKFAQYRTCLLNYYRVYIQNNSFKQYEVVRLTVPKGSRWELRYVPKFLIQIYKKESAFPTKEFFMRTISFYLLFSIALSSQMSAQILSAQKVLVSITDDWNSDKATLYLFDKTNDGWKKHRLVFSVSIGRNGLAWGEGIYPKQNGEFIKKEGDNRSPAGVFELDTLFYGLNENAPNGVRIPYLPLTKLTRCVDDEQSAVYNSIVEDDSLKRDWNSAERMGYVDPDYKYVLVIKHNPKREPGKGSCIFIHTVNVPTSGCTSMDEEDMLTLLRWLDPNKKTVIVQLPHSEYHRLRSEWNLPKLLNN